MAGERITIRSWQDGDDAIVSGMLDRSMDPLWIAQALHGPDLESPKFRKSLLAMVDDDVVGVGTVSLNPVHPGRYPAAIDVRLDVRRQGIGSRLLLNQMNARPQPLPLATKIHRRNSAAVEFARHRGGASYQNCSSTFIDPSQESVQQWAAETLQLPGSNDVFYTALGRDHNALRAFVDMYLWVHKKWSPVGDTDSLCDIAETVLRSLDKQLSVAAWRAGTIEAAVFAFRDGDDVEIVAETTRRLVADGSHVLSRALSATLTACSNSGVRRVEFDGHVSDPHLESIVATLPGRSIDPLMLMEFQHGSDKGDA